MVMKRKIDLMIFNLKVYKFLLELNVLLGKKWKLYNTINKKPTIQIEII